MRRTAFPIVLALLSAVSLPAKADTQLDRFEALSEQVTTVMNEAMILEVPALEGNLPTADWDDEMRGAFTCVLEDYRAAVGDDAINTMLDEMEATLPDMTAEAMMSGEMNERFDLPDGLTEARAAEIVRNCGVMTLYMTRMMDSGAAEILAAQ